MRAVKRAILVTAVAVFALFCAPKEKPLSVPGEKLYTLTGKIVSRDTADNTLRIDHEAIPGFMEAMTMDYTVRGAKVEQLPPDGTKIHAKLHVVDDAYWVSDVRTP